MNLRNSGFRKQAVHALLGAALACGLTVAANAQGTWTPLTNSPSQSEGLDIALQLMDGRVVASGTGNNTWYALTPDINGSYANGTWSPLASMTTGRLFFVTKVLPNGDIFVAGGEYAKGVDGQANLNTCERYDTLHDMWISLPSPAYGANFTDRYGNTHNNGDIWAGIGAAPAVMLPNSLILVGDLSTPTAALFDYTTNSWTAVNSFKANSGPSSDEEDWTLLPDGTVETVDCVTNDPATNMPPVGFDFSQRFFPGNIAANGTWASTPNTPSGLVDHVPTEIGPGMLLPNGLNLYIGGLNHTALYNYLTNTWVAGPNMFAPDGTPLGSEDGPGCVEINGKALICVGPVGNYPAGVHFLEYTYSATPNADGSYGSFSEIAPPPGYVSTDHSSFTSQMLQLANGQILFSDEYTTQQFVYTPQGSPAAGAAPKISGITNSGSGTYLLKGTQLNGLTEGAYYGDDKQMSTNYPLVRFTDSAKHVFYGRTFSPSTMGLATGNTQVSVSFVPPSTLPSGVYSLQVVANGIASPATKFVKP